MISQHYEKRGLTEIALFFFLIKKIDLNGNLIFNLTKSGGLTGLLIIEQETIILLLMCVFGTFLNIVKYNNSQTGG